MPAWRPCGKELYYLSPGRGGGFEKPGSVESVSG